MKTYLLKAGVRQAIAKAGETDIAVAYNAKAWIDEYPAGNPQLMVTTPGGKRVPVTVETVDNLITGQVPNELLAGPGVYSYVFVWTSGSTQLESGRCECLVLGSNLAQDLAHDSRRTPDWAERIFLAAEVIEGSIDGAIEARNTAADMAAEAAESEANAAGSAEDAEDSAALADQKATEAHASAVDAAASAAAMHPENYVAQAFSASSAYSAGTYVMHDGYLYKLTADHDADVTWENTAKVQVKVADDVGDLKSASTAFVEDGVMYIDKTINWQSGYISNVGKVSQSTASGYAIVQMYAGETVEIGTSNSNITIIGSTTAESLDIGDNVTIIQKTTSSGNFETYTYTTMVDIKIVLCVNLSDYICHFTKKAPALAKVAEESNSFGRILYKGFELIENEWEKGGLEQGKNDSYRIDCRIRLKNIVYTPVDITFFTKTSNTAFWVGMYDVNGIYTGSSAKQTSKYKIPSGTYFRMMIDGSDNTAAQTQSVSEILAKIYKTDKNINDVCSLSQTPNITFMCRDGRVTPNLPPNSKYAIMATAENQYDMIRFSVTKTTDGEYVAVHDVTINNLAVNMDGTPIGTTIRTDECSLAQLNQYDWGRKFGDEYAGLRVPMLEDCLSLASMYNLRVALDFKWGDFTDAEADAIVAMLAKYGQYNAFIIVSYNVNKSLFASKNKRFSQGFIGNIESVVNNAEFINSLLSTRNHVYLWTTPTDPPTTELINYAMAHDLDIICSEIEGLESLISFGFDKGVTLMECHYIENIKTTVMDYANSIAQ